MVYYQYIFLDKFPRFSFHYSVLVDLSRFIHYLILNILYYLLKLEDKNLFLLLLNKSFKLNLIYKIFTLSLGISISRKLKKVLVLNLELLELKVKNIFID